MGQLVTLPADRHQETQLLLPWYLTGKLDDAERAIVEAHLGECAECRGALADEPDLRDAVDDVSSAAEQGWAALEARMGAAPPLPPAVPARSARRRWTASGRALARPDRLKWVVAAQFAVLAVLAIAALPSSPAAPGREGTYRALGDAPAARTGNVLAMFRPDASVGDLRRSLEASGARLVDGPTAAGAYVLDVPGGEQGAPLASLRRDPHVTMAEPIEQAPAE